MIYTQKDFIRLVSDKSGYYQHAVKAVLDAAQQVSEELMVNSSGDDPITIKIFEGLTLVTKYYKEREVLNPKSGEKVVTSEHIYPHAKYSQAFGLRVRDAWEEKQREG